MNFANQTNFQPSESASTQPSQTVVGRLSFLRGFKLYWLLASCLLLLILFVVYQRVGRVRTVTVFATGEVVAASNRAEITFVYSQQGLEQTELAQQGEAAFQNLVAQLENIGMTEIAAANPQLGASSLNPGSVQYARGAVGTLTDLSQVAAVENTIQRTGATVIETRYLPTDDRRVTNQLHSDLMTNARRSAGSAARSSGGLLGGVISFVELDSDEEVGRTTTQLSGDNPNQITITKAAQVTFRLY